MLSKDIAISRKFNDIPGNSGKLRNFPQLVYLMVLPHLDDFGRLCGDPVKVKALCLPLFTEPVKYVEDSLRLLHECGLIEWYEVSGEFFINYNGFDNHQTGLHKRTESKFPPPSGKFPEIPGNSALTEGKRREGKGRQVKPDKKLYQDFVLLSVLERESLELKIGTSSELYITRLNDYIGSKGKHYDSHYHTILTWWRKDNPPKQEAAPYVPKLSL